MRGGMVRSHWGRVPAACMVLALTACSGGGGGEGGGGAGDGGGGGGVAGEAAQPPPASWFMTLSPTEVSGNQFKGESAFFSVSLSFGAAIDLRNGVTLEAYYDHSVLTAFRLYLTEPGGRVEFNSLSTLPVGDYAGTISFRVCKTDSCAEKYSDVPATLGYRLTVSTAPPAAIVTPSSFTSTIEAGSHVEVLLSAGARPDIRTATGALTFSVADT